MWNSKCKTVIYSAVALALLLGISATGLTAVLKNNAEAALGQQPAATESNTKSASNSSDKSYHVELGDSGSDDKSVSGDHKTPEGSFYITQKLVLSPSDEYLGTRWMRLSYPQQSLGQTGPTAVLV